MTHKQKANAFKKKFGKTSRLVGIMNIVENPESKKSKGKRGYSAVPFFLQNNSGTTLKEMRRFMKAHGQSTLDLKKGGRITGIGTGYTAIFKND